MRCEYDERDKGHSHVGVGLDTSSAHDCLRVIDLVGGVAAYVSPLYGGCLEIASFP